MQVHSILSVEPQVSTPVRVSFTQGPMEDQEKFNELIRSCAYQLYISHGRKDGHALDHWLEAEALVLGSEAHCPVGFIDLDEAMDVEASVGDFSAEDLEVTVDPFRLIISGDRGRLERAEGHAATGQEPHPIFIILSLPVEVDPSRATVKLKGGMLHMVLPKKAKAHRPRARAKAA